MEERQSRYCYPNSEVLINKLNIKNEKELNEKERVITTLRISQIKCNNISFGDCLSVNTYFKVHEWIFKDIYSFAGNIRDEFIYKSNLPYHQSITPFCDPKYISSSMQDLFRKLNVRVKKISSSDDFLDCIAWFYSEMNVIHPFREGNGRTLRAFVELLVEEVNHYLPIPDMEIHYSMWDDDDRKELLKATIYSALTGDESKIKQCLAKVIVCKDIKKKSR